MFNAYNISLTVFLITSLFAVDLFLGKGFVNKSMKFPCKFLCFMKKALRDDVPDDDDDEKTGNEGLINLPMLLVELVLLTITVAVLNRLRHARGKDKIDELLNESKETLRKTSEYLEKWRLQPVPSEYAYFDEDLRGLEQLTMEVPVLQMALVDSQTMCRSQLEGGDAGETVYCSDATLLSVSSLLDDSSDSIADIGDEQVHDDCRDVEMNNRYLWDVIEEDSNISE